VVCGIRHTGWYDVLAREHAGQGGRLQQSTKVTLAIGNQILANSCHLPRPPRKHGLGRDALEAGPRHNEGVEARTKPLSVPRGAGPRWLPCGLLILASVLGACAVPPKVGVPSSGAPPLAASAAAAVPAAAAKPPEPTAVPAAPVVAPAAAPVDMPRALLAVRTLLDAGEAADAERELQVILQAEPQNAQALSYLRQIREDPLVLLGRESHPYRVAAGESLSSIAGRALKDSHLFYALARYNNIKVPRQLAAGQVIRVPGRALAPVAQSPAGGTGSGGGAASAKPNEAAPGAPAGASGGASTSTSSGTASGSSSGAPSGSSAAGAPTAGAPTVGATTKPADAAAAGGGSGAASTAALRPRSNTQLIAEFSRSARSCGQRQEPCCAVANWDKVLELDPAHVTAKLEKQKEQDRIERLRKQNSNPGC
jgi:LysM repeat protein